MMLSFRQLATSLVTLTVAAAPALAQEPVPQDATVVVVTPSAPVIVNGDPNSGAPGTVLPGMPQPAQQVAPAPQNEKWEDVSHINGQIVPVGQRGDYLKRFPKTNISTNPISWMFGLYGVSVSQALGTNVALRGDLNIASFDNQSGYEVGVSLPIYFKRTYSGPFLEPGIIVRDLHRNDGSTSDFDSSSESMVGPEVMIGWHWTFDSGLNMSFAVGAAKNISKKMSTSEFDSNDEVQPAGYFRVGYAF